MQKTIHYFLAQELYERPAKIAATALAYRFEVATRDAKPFEGAGLKVINPWKP